MKAQIIARYLFYRKSLAFLINTFMTSCTTNLIPPKKNFEQQSAYQDWHCFVMFAKCIYVSYSNLEGGKNTVTTFVDLEKAFGAVNREILQQKL